MDQLRKRIGHTEITYKELVDELEYNFERKEDLKREVKKLDEDKEELRVINFKNAEVCFATKAENNKLRKTIETLQNEIDNLKYKYDEILSLQSENRILTDKIESMENEEEFFFKNLEKTNKSLQMRIESFLKCDECNQHFHDKNHMKTHLLMNHLQSVIKCEVCGNKFKTESDLETHMIEHTKQSKMNLLLQRETELISRISMQKIKMSEDIYLIKQREDREKGKCKCRGLFCTIKHHRFRWTSSNSDILLHKFKLFNSNESYRSSRKFKCDWCYLEFNNEHIMKKHTKLVHVQEPRFPCAECEDMFHREEDLKNHMEIHHTTSIFERTFFNPSL